MTDIVERLRGMVAAGLAARTQSEYTAAGEKLIRAMPELIDEIGRLRADKLALDRQCAGLLTQALENGAAAKGAINERDNLREQYDITLESLFDADRRVEEYRTKHDEITQAHTALVARLYDVTTMLEAERAENARLRAQIEDKVTP